jgi:subtilisin family serine protease/regulation of enolase protein 1 (concanavalin A-like superfamily)
MTSVGFRIIGARGVAIGAAVAAVFLASSRAPQAQAPRTAGQQLLVKYKPSAGSAHRQAAMQRVNARLRARFANLEIDQIEVPAELDVREAAAALALDPAVQYAQPNYVREISAAGPPNDPAWLSDTMWGLSRIKAPAAWNSFPTSARDIVVAVIDTGVNYLHPDLAGSRWLNAAEIPGNGVDDDRNGYVDDVYGVDTFNRDGDPMDDNGHGTHAAGTIGAQGNNGIGGIGVAWSPQLLACKFLDANGSGFDAGAIACFDYVIEQKKRGVNIRVSNNSWGSVRDPGGAFPQALKDAVDRLGQAGIVNVFAAGNSGVNVESAPFDPASFTSPSIVSVAASDEADARASFSNYGASSVDLAAPGANIYSTYRDGYAFLNGTSMAAPHVSGTLALMASLNATLTVDALKARLLASVDPLAQWSGATTTAGRLNVFQALLAATDNAGADELSGAGWSHADVGATGATGSASLVNGTFSVGGAGADVWGTADAFHYAYRMLNGDGAIVARITGIQNVNSWTKAGVMIRGSLSPSAAQAFMLVAASPLKGAPFQRRVADGAGSVSTTGSQATAPRWVKLVRQGTTISAYDSIDGSAWTLVGSDTFAMGSTVVVGLAVSSHVTGVNATATFDNVAVQSFPRPADASPLPAGWSQADIGVTPVTGDARAANGTFTVTGSGADVWGTADAFHYAYTPLAGDATIVARVTAIPGDVNAWVKAGVMIRESQAAGSAHAFMLVSAAKGTAFQRRALGNDVTTSTPGVFAGAPRWVKLQRAGNTFTAYESVDGVAWTLVGSDTVAMGANVLVGLAVTSHSSAPATCTFDSVAIF